MPLSQSETERVKLLLEQARKLRERSALLHGQSKDLQKLVREQHHEMLLLLETSLNAISPVDGKSPRANR